MVICEKFVNDSDHIQGNVIEPTMMLLDDKKIWSNPKRDENDNETIVRKGQQDVASVSTYRQYFELIEWFRLFWFEKSSVQN